MHFRNVYTVYVYGNPSRTLANGHSVDATTYRIEPAPREGTIRLYDEAGVEAIRYALRRIAPNGW
jgi:hypothetical protein